MVNADSLINFGTSGLNVGDITYSAYPLSAPAYLPLNDDTASYLTSSYPALGAIYAPTTVAYSTTTKTIPFAEGNYSFVFGNNVFLGWASRGSIITSTDGGNTWLRSAINTDLLVSGLSSTTTFPALISGQTNPWQQMIYGNGKFVAVRVNPVISQSTNYGATPSIGAIAVSNDNGQTWIQGTIPNSQYYTGSYYNVISYQWTTIGYTGSRFFIAGYIYNGTAYYRVSAYSPDGIQWSTPTQNSQLSVSSVSYTNMASGNNVILSIENQSGQATPTVVYTSTTTAQMSWQNVAGVGTSQYWKSVTFGNGIFVLVGASDTNQNTTVAYTSTNGTSWTARTMPASLMWVSVTFANGYFVAVGQDYTGTSTTNVIATSTDGITWTLRAAPTSTITRGVIAGGNGKFIFQDGGSSTIGVISLSTSASTFTLPMVAPMKAMTPYIKAT